MLFTLNAGLATPDACAQKGRHNALTKEQQAGRPQCRQRRLRVVSAHALDPPGFLRCSVTSTSHAPSGAVMYLSPLSAVSPEISGLALPVYIGLAEYDNLKAKLENHHSPRPMTHDLMVNIINALNCPVTFVAITSLRLSTYYARVHLQKPGANGTTDWSLDARPSDAVNVALRCGAPIFVATDLLRTQGVRPASPPALPAHKGVPLATDGALLSRMRMSLAVMQGRDADAARLRDEVAANLGAAQPTHAAAAATLLLELERAVRDERWADAAVARNHLRALVHVLVAAPAQEPER